MTDRNGLHDPNEPPEDVASLYSWANLHGAKYRDFSASRAQNREKARMQMQQAIDEQQRAQRGMELQQAEAARDAAQAALAAERARQAEMDAHYAAQQAALQAAQQAAFESAQLAARQAAQQAAQEMARQAAEQAAREARAAQLAAQQAAQQAAQELARQAAEHAAQQAAQEMARQAAEQAAREARAAQEAAQRAAQEAAQQAAQEMARQAAEQAAREAHAAQEAAWQAAQEAARQAAQEAARQAAAQEAAQRAVQEAAQRAAEEAAQEMARQAAEQAAEEARIAQAQAAQQAAQQAAEHAAQEMARQAAEHAAEEARVAQLQAAQHAEAARAAQQAAQQAAWQQPIPERLSPAAPSPQAEHFGFPAAAGFPLPNGQAQRTTQRITAREDAVPPPARTPWSTPEPREIPARPAWLAERPTLSGVPIVTQTPEDTLQGSRERLTSRWFALKGVFDTGGNAIADAAVPAAATSRAPVLAVFSLAGGVGKTSMVATLGRALSSRGERVLLVDTAAFGLLPFFFGARDQRPGQLRTFSPPAASGDAPIQMIAVDPESLGPENGGQEPLTAEIQQHIRSVGRVIVDLATASGSTTRRLLRLSPSVLVPVIPDMNSVVSVGSIDAFFERNSSLAGKASLPHYVLNQFDASLPLHLDVREVLREQLGDRLLPFALRRAPAISEALAEGMTVMDYAPNSTVAEDFGTLAGWVKSQSAPASSGFRGVRWSER